MGGIIDRLMSGAFSSHKDSLEITAPPVDSAEDDCRSCRVLGSTAFASLGFYTYYSGMKQLRERQHLIEKSKSKYKTGSRQLGIVTLSATFVGLGIYRMLN